MGNNKTKNINIVVEHERKLLCEQGWMLFKMVMVHRQTSRFEFL